MERKRRSSSKMVQAREAARVKSARFRQQEDERLRIAQDAILLQEQIADFDAETERRVAKLREERGGLLVEKRAKIDALVVEMLDTGVPPQEVAERMGMSASQVRTAKRTFDKAVAEIAGEGSADVAAGLEEVTVDSGAEPTEADVLPPSVGPVVPSQEGSPEDARDATLPPGSPAG
ncbi:hypothetical protein [Streptomyces niveus]|uniref:hypothetical protein n=1 Tax=Streptomyces niveus TaxID=193462 RepID=UPI0036BB97BF